MGRSRPQLDRGMVVQPTGSVNSSTACNTVEKDNQIYFSTLELRVKDAYQFNEVSFSGARSYLT